MITRVSVASLIAIVSLVAAGGKGCEGPEGKPVTPDPRSTYKADHFGLPFDTVVDQKTRVTVVVGSDIRPGVYGARVPSRSPKCTWELDRKGHDPDYEGPFAPGTDVTIIAVNGDVISETGCGIFWIADGK